MDRLQLMQKREIKIQTDATALVARIRPAVPRVLGVGRAGQPLVPGRPAAVHVDPLPPPVDHHAVGLVEARGQVLLSAERVAHEHPEPGDVLALQLRKGYPGRPRARCRTALRSPTRAISSPSSRRKGHTP
jgi:hypothetical protein